MKNTKFLLIGCLTLLLASCSGAKIYSDTNAVSLAKQHSTLAILPPKVSIEAKKNVDAESLKEQQKTESVNFQHEMYSWMLKRKSQGKIKVDIQEVETTIAKLTNAGYYKGEKAFTPVELAEILGVDAVLASNYSLSKPMSIGAAIAVGVLFGAFGATDKTVIDLSLFDRKSDKMIWNYNHKASGSFSSANRLVDNLMQNASKKMPYSQK